MKRSLKILIGLVLAIPFLISAGCPGFQRGPCYYEDKEVEAYISHYELAYDSTFTLWFNALEEQESWVWRVDDENKSNVRVHSSDFERYDLTVEHKTLDDTSIRYLVAGSFITKGTCGPKNIASIQRIN